MAQRISRAKRTLRNRNFTEPGDLAVVLRVLSLVYHTGGRGLRAAGSDAAPARPPAGAHQR